MKLFGKDESKSSAHKGNFGDMMKMREETRPDIEKNIEDVLKDYNGEMVAVIRINEDENGDPVSSHIFVGGVAGLKSSVKMVEGLEETASDLKESISDRLKEHPDMIADALTSVLEKANKLAEELEKRTKK